MIRLYLVPIVELSRHRGPEYIYWEAGPPNPVEHPGIVCPWGIMDYGFIPICLLVADITQADHDALVFNDDVFSFPENLDGPVDQEVQPFFESVHLPTDWLTPSTTWRELLRQTAGMFQFNQRYGGISKTHHLAENIGSLSFLEGPYRFQDAAQDFTDWANGDWCLRARATYIAPVLQTKWSDGAIIKDLLPLDVRKAATHIVHTVMAFADGLLRPPTDMPTPHGTLEGIEVVDAIVQRGCKGWIGAAAGDTATVYQDRALTVPGWDGYYDPDSLITIDGYFVASGYNRSIFDTATLDTRLREMEDYEQAWFLATVASFGYDPGLVPVNARLRQLVKAAGDYWAGRSFNLGLIEF